MASRAVAQLPSGRASFIRLCSRLLDAGRGQRGLREAQLAGEEVGEREKKTLYCLPLSGLFARCAEQGAHWKSALYIFPYTFTYTFVLASCVLLLSAQAVNTNRSCLRSSLTCGTLPVR